jgi:ketosteroid isomerase-like protein
VSQENVDFLSGLFAAVDTLDKDELLAALPHFVEETCDPEVEWVEDPERADGHVYRGHRGVRDSWTRWLEDFSEYGFEVESVTDYGERVLVVGVERGRGNVSGAPVSSRVHAVVSFRDGKILRYEEFYDERPALEAVTRPD